MKALACAKCLKHVTIVGLRQILLRAEETNLARYDSHITTRFSRLLKEDSDGNILHILWDQTSYMTTHTTIWTSTT